MAGDLPSLESNPFVYVAQALLDCAEDELAKHDRTPGMVHLAPGRQVAWDNCCEGGQLWVRVISMHPSGEGVTGSSFPDRVVRDSCAPATWAVQLGVGIVRCVATVNETGEPPNETQITNDAVNMLDDMELLRRAIVCNFRRGVTHVQRILLDSWTPQGVDGGCGGGEWTLWVGVTNYACPDE